MSVRWENDFESLRFIASRNTQNSNRKMKTIFSIFDQWSHWSFQIARKTVDSRKWQIKTSQVSLTYSLYFRRFFILSKLWHSSVSHDRGYYLLIFVFCLTIFLVKYSTFRIVRINRTILDNKLIINAVSIQGRNNLKHHESHSMFCPIFHLRKFHFDFDEPK